MFASLIFFSLTNQIFSIIKTEISFSTSSQAIYQKIDKEDIYIVKASFTNIKYLYIYPLIDINNINKGVFKIFFKKYLDSDETANSLNSDYYTLEVNSGLYINAKNLGYNIANIFIVTYGQINLYMGFIEVDSITVPQTTLVNQFLLPKGEKVTIAYSHNGNKIDDAITVISKYSLRNIEITLTDNYKKDITFENGGYFYPNGYSFIFDKDNYQATYYLEINNKKNINSRDEIIIIGYIKYNAQTNFLTQIVNGNQYYLEKVYKSLFYLENGLSNPFYYTYQIYGKGASVDYLNDGGYFKGKYTFEDYNSMVCDNIDTYKTVYNFEDLKTGIYIQFFDFNDLQTLQKNLQPLVSGLPKSMLIPAKKSLYHFLPILDEAKEIHYYIRSKSQNSQMFVAFKTCQSYPDNCYYNEALTSTSSMPLINNIGMWSSQNNTNSSSPLQLIYIYCQTECAYDVIMSYDEDPLFLFPDNNYTKYLGENKKDIFQLPVFEYLSTYDELKLDLTVISGNAKLTLYESLEKLSSNNPLKYDSEKVGTRQSITISKSTFTSASYYNKEFYALVEGDIGSFYNLMYTSISSGNRILDNNKVFNDLITVGQEKTFTFENKRGEFYISITTHNCKSQVTINDNQQANQDKHHLYKFTNKNKYTVKVSLLSDDEICINNFEDQIILYAYNTDNAEILISENTYMHTSYIGSKINFKYFFNPNSENGDNSYNIELERLSSTQVSFEYKIERISFDKTQVENTQKYSLSQPVVSKKNAIITSQQIESICNDLNKNEICGLTLSFTPLSNNIETSFSFYLNKNSKNYAHPLTQETLIDSVNSNTAQYYYIELNKNYDTEIILNSFGNDLELGYDISNDKTKTVIPFSKFENAKNYHLIHITKSELNKCGSFCRLYIGVHLSQTEKELVTTYSINYFFIEEKKQKSDINLAFNYYSRYKFDDIESIAYTLQSHDSSNVIFELSAETPNSELTGTVTYSGNSKELKSEEKLSIDNLSGEIKITIINPGKDISFKIKATTIGKKLNAPLFSMLSSFSDKCIIEDKNSACYYYIDITPEMANNNNLLLFVPESEDIYLSIQDLDFGYVEKPNTDMNTYLSLAKEYTYTTKGLMQRPNWCEYAIDGTKSLLVRVASFTGNKIVTNLHSSFYTKPNNITLNYGEKRIFTIKENENKVIYINIPKANGSKNKYRINLNAIKGNGVFKILEQIYPLGLQANFKEDMSIIIDSDNIQNNFILTASNKYDETKINEFAFSIEYIVESKNKLIYEIENGKMNSFKFYKDATLGDIHLYMKANYTIISNKQTYKDINMNIKIYTKNAEYEIKTYIIDESTLEKCLDNSINEPTGNTVGNLINYIQGGKSENGEFTFSKLEIASNIFDNYVNETKNLYIYLLFKQKDGSQNKNVIINLYSYDMTNKKALASNELYIQKIPPNSLNYQFLIVKTDLFWDNDIILEYSHPDSQKYDYGAIHSENKINEIARTKNIIRTSSTLNNGNNELLLDSRGIKLRYLLFNIYAEENNLESNEKIFLYKYRQNIVGENRIYFEDCNLNFNVTGGSKFTFNFATYNPRRTTGSSIIIIKGYQKSSVSANDTTFSLFFSGKNADFTHYIEGKTKDKIEVSHKLSGGEYTFACLQVIEEYEREEYIGQKLFTIKIDSDDDDSPIGGLIDYIKNHVFASIVIGVIIILFLALMINICRHENKKKKGVEINVNEVSGGLTDT